MASFPTSLILYFFFFFFFFFTLFFFKPITALSNSSFSFNNFGPNSTTLHSLLTLYGDAKALNNGSSVQLTSPLQYSVGQVTYEKPIRFYGGNPKKLVSFSTYFSFSMSSGFGTGDGLGFVMFYYDGHLFDDNGPFGLSKGGSFKFLNIEFDTLNNDKFDGMKGTHIGIQQSSYVFLNVANLSSVNLGLNSGDRLQVWIDYESGSRRLEARLNRFGEDRPIDPLLFEQMDLDKIWPENEWFYVGLVSSNGNSSQICNVYSWSFTTRQSPDWMHSEPLDPVVFKGNETEIKIIKKNDDCVIWILSALVLGIGVGGLGSFVGMFLWMMFVKRRPVSPEEYVVKVVVDDDKSLRK